MSRRGTWLAVASLACVPFARDAFQAPQLLVLAAGVFVGWSSHVSRVGLQVLGVVASAAVGTAVMGVEPLLSVSALLGLFIPLVFAFLGSSLDLRALLWTVWPISAWALLQAVGADPMEWQSVARWCGGLRPFSTLGHPTQLGVWMACLSVIALDAWAEGRRRLHLAASLVAVMTCVLTLSRAGWLVLVVTLGAWLLTRRQQLAPARLGLWVAAGVGALGLGAVVTGPGAVWERLLAGVVAPTRRMLWETALEGFQQRPLGGWGFGSFLLVDQQFRQADAWRFEWGGTALHAHAVVPEVLATQGLVGIFALGVAIVLTVRAWRVTAPWRTQPLAFALFLGLAAGTMVTFLNALPTALALVALVQTLGPSQVENRLPRVVALAPVVLMSLVVAASLAPPAVAKQLEPWNVRWPTLEAAALEEAGALTQAATVYGDTARRFASLAHSHANRGRVASKQGDVLEAAEAFAVARRLAPRDARIALDAAEAFLRSNAWPEAEAVLVEVLTQYPDDGPAWFALGKLRLHQQRTLEARAAFEAAEQADWRDWPEGLGVARAALSTLHLAEGNPDLAAALLQRSRTFATPADACGAPSALR